MAPPRFFCALPLQARQTVQLPSDLAHYALRVLRLKDRAPITLFDGQGGQYDAQLQIEGKSAWAEVGAHDDVEAELPGRITLMQGLPSGDKMDWVVEKAVELGVHALVPIAAQRSVVQLNAERSAKRVQHWERVIRSASEQCGRNRLMSITTPMTLDAVLAARRDADNPLLLCHPEARHNLAQSIENAQDITLMIGPEGGWSPQEHDLALGHGATPVRFGNRVLRTETAGIALVAAVSALKGWT